MSATINTWPYFLKHILSLQLSLPDNKYPASYPKSLVYQELAHQETPYWYLVLWMQKAAKKGQAGLVDVMPVGSPAFH